ncbi:MAG: M23 family metallopeptidase [Oscillospiraceae bacterium]|nr:M23 family metallopeptidase [Oscillospiraceae bacterium]
MKGSNRERPYRMRHRSRTEPETDTVTFSLAVQTVIVLALLLSVVTVKMTDEGKYLRLKGQYSVMLSSSSEPVETQDLASASKRMLNGITEAVKGFRDWIFGETQDAPYYPSDIEEPGDFWSEPQVTSQSEAALPKQTTSFFMRLHDAQWYTEEDKALPEQGGVLYLRPPDKAGMFPVEIMERGGVMQTSYAAAFSPLFWPVLPPAQGVITSGFSLREHPISGKEEFHNGIDIAANDGDDILAAMSGTVKRTGVSEIYGNYVILKHSSRLETSYSHCSEILVKEGMYVRQGERIARVGDTGVTTGPHLHFSVISDGNYTDPARLLRDYIEMIG